MTAKHKAEQLYNICLEKFGHTDASCIDIAKLLVDEIINTNPCELDFAQFIPSFDYWEEVKEELNKI
jgi:hypothetical protein